jgi:hypothetical protein
MELVYNTGFLKDEMFMSFNYSDLKRIASHGNKGQRDWLEWVLTKTDDVPQKRTLLDRLRRWLRRSLNTGFETLQHGLWQPIQLYASRRVAAFVPQFPRYNGPAKGRNVAHHLRSPSREERKEDTGGYR